MITTAVHLHGVKPEDVEVFGGFPDMPRDPVVSLRIGDVSVYISDTAVLDALHEATIKAYELLVEGVMAS